MKTFFRICIVIAGIAFVAMLIYFFVSRAVPIVGMSLYVSAISWVMVGEQTRREKKENQPKSRFYFYLFILFGIFSLVGAVLMSFSGNFTFTV